METQRMAAQFLNDLAVVLVAALVLAPLGIGASGCLDGGQRVDNCGVHLLSLSLVR